MAKMPFMKFYPADFTVDTQTLSLKEIGAWMKLICFIWIQSKRGTVKISNQELAHLFGLEIDEALEIFCRLWDKGVFEVTRHVPSEKDQEIDQNMIINTITSRRIAKDKKELSMNALYVSKHRSKAICKENVSHKKSEVRSQKSEEDLNPLPPKRTDFEIPADLVESKAEIEDWLTYKRQKGQTYKPKGLEALWRAFRAIPKDRRRASVDHSMSNNWQGLFEKKGDFNGQRSEKIGAAPVPGKYDRFNPEV